MAWVARTGRRGEQLKIRTRVEQIDRDGPIELLEQVDAWELVTAEEYGSGNSFVRATSVSGAGLLTRADTAAFMAGAVAPQVTGLTVQASGMQRDIALHASGGFVVVVVAPRDQIAFELTPYLGDVQGPPIRYSQAQTDLDLGT